MTTYTVLAYREDAVDTCRGCVMDRSSSAFEFKVCSSLEEAAEFYADKNWDSENRTREFAPWDLTVLIDGLDQDAWWSRNMDNDLIQPSFDLVERMSIDYFEARRAAEAQRKLDEAERGKAQARLEQERRKLERDAKERAEFERLSKKFSA